MAEHNAIYYRQLTLAVAQKRLLYGKEQKSKIIWLYKYVISALRLAILGHIHIWANLGGAPYCDVLLCPDDLHIYHEP